jgi:hypothetical protein
MGKNNGSKYSTPKGDAFSGMALWQFMAFIVLLCFVWTSEILDLPSMVFGAEETPFNLYRACLLTAGILTAGIIAVGHSYERQRRLVKELLMSCLYCHRVKTDKGEWMHVEDYFLAHYPVAVDRSSCPECQQMLKSIEGAQDSKAKA